MNDAPATLESPARLTAQQWLVRVDCPDAELRRIYGADDLHERMALIRRVLNTFIRRFGDRPVRLFRSPGRLNLRGMHVDTHGGYLNLMTHQRETVLAVAPSGDAGSICVNISSSRREVDFDATIVDVQREWLSVISDPALLAAHPSRGHWGRYMEGCALRVRHAFPDAPSRGLLMTVGGDIPQGAALSSSASLCVAGVLAYLGVNGLGLDPAALILAARDAEWYAGSRCGVSDQAAMVLGGHGEVVNVALFAASLDVSGARSVRLPEDWSILVANSHTRRSLSGAQMLEYTRNRFAYSLALEVLRQEMCASGYAHEVVARLDRLSGFSPAMLPEWEDPARIYALIERIPEDIAVDKLRKRYDLHDLDGAYEVYFGSLPPESQPTRFQLRGPLLFGLAESERARVFPALLERGDCESAGRLMSIGHDGDRCLAADGTPYRFSVDDAALRRYAEERRPLVNCPGVYGASSPALDTLVDAALRAGACGACLTGAGIAGAILALCRREDVGSVAQALRNRMASPDYATLAHLAHPLTSTQLAEAVVENQAIAPACELL